MDQENVNKLGVSRSDDINSSKVKWIPCRIGHGWFERLIWKCYKFVSGGRLQIQWMQVGIRCCQEILLLTKTNGAQSLETSIAFFITWPQ